jgi:ABC transporter substrate binding protein
MTGVNFFIQEITAKRLGLLHELVPKAARIAVLVNPANAASAERTLKEVQAAAPVLGLQIHVFNAGTSNEIDVAFAGMVRERCEALLIGGDALFNGRRVQLAIMAARDRLPTSFTVREFVEAGGLMSYGTNLADSFRQVGTYTGSIINGAKPAELPVLQSTKFEFANSLIPRVARRSREGDGIAHIGEARDVGKRALEARVRHRAVAAQIAVPGVVLLVDAALRHAGVEHIEPLLALAAADDLADPGGEDVHRRDGFAVVVHAHVERLDVFRVGFSVQSGGAKRAISYPRTSPALRRRSIFSRAA